MNGERNRVLLLYPAAGSEDLNLIPLSLLYVAQPLIDCGFEVELIDQRCEKDFFKRVEERLTPGLICVGISCITGPQIDQVIRIAEFIKKTNDTPVVLGGPHPTLFPEQTLESSLIDYVVIGQGEAPFLELVRRLKTNASKGGLSNIGYRENGRIVIKRGSAREFNVRRIPYHLVSRYGRPSTLPILSSYGCTHRCTFCVERVLHPIYRETPLDDVICMLEDGLRLRPQFINFFDDNFLLNKKRVVALFSLCLRKNLDFLWICTGRVDAVLSLEEETLRFLKQRGLIGIYFGIESGSPRILKLINKGISPEMVLELNLRLRREGIIPHYSFMAGFPTETEKDFKETLNLMQRLKRENPRAVIWKVNQYTPYPGTELFDLAVQNGFKPPKRLEEWSHVYFYSKEYGAPFDVQL